MAYPTVSSAFGFVPINELNGLPYAGATRQIPIPYAYSTRLYRDWETDRKSTRLNSSHRL